MEALLQSLHPASFQLNDSFKAISFEKKQFNLIQLNEIVTAMLKYLEISSVFV